MLYLAVMDTNDYEWVCMSDSEASAKQGVFDGYNTHLKKQFERENIAIETTSEYLDNRLVHYYKTHFDKGKVGVETLENQFGIQVLELLKDQVYRDGFNVPRREQDF